MRKLIVFTYIAEDQVNIPLVEEHITGHMYWTLHSNLGSHRSLLHFRSIIRAIDATSEPELGPAYLTRDN